MLFMTSIKENLSLGQKSQSTTATEMEEAARVANTYSIIIKLSHGYYTPGSGTEGGEGVRWPREMPRCGGCGVRGSREEDA